MIAPSATAETPEAITESYFQLLQQSEWRQVADLYSPTALKDFREMMAFLTELPDEVSGEVLANFFGADATQESVAAMSDPEYFAVFLGAMMAQASQVGQLDFTEIEVLGTVPEGDAVRHVLTRTHIKLGEVAMESMEVISLEQVDNAWKILMQGKMKGMASQLKAALGQG
jgi:hypothetical protein